MKKAIKKTTIKKAPVKKVVAKKTVAKKISTKKTAKKLSEDEKEYFDLLSQKEKLKLEFVGNRKKMLELNSYFQSFFKDFQMGPITDEDKEIFNIPEESMVTGFKAVRHDNEEQNQLASQFFVISSAISPMQQIMERSLKNLDKTFKDSKVFIDKYPTRQRATLRELVKLEFMIDSHKTELSMVKKHLKMVEEQADTIILQYNKLKGISEKKDKRMIN